MKDLKTLAFELTRYAAAEACTQLVCRFFDLHTLGRNTEIPELFSDREDGRLEMPWGIYEGKEGVTRCFTKDYGDVRDPEAMEKFKGNLNVHSFGTTVIEFDDENTIARMIGNGPGFETYAEADGAKAIWSWAKYGIDCIYEEGEWKIWSMKIYPLFRSPYDVSFVDYDKVPFEGFMENAQPDRPLEHPLFHYDPNRPLPTGQPEVVEPYHRYEDRGYIW